MYGGGTQGIETSAVDYKPSLPMIMQTYKGGAR